MRARSVLTNKLRGSGCEMSVMARPVPDRSAAWRSASKRLARSATDRSKDPDIASQHSPGGLLASPGNLALLPRVWKGRRMKLVISYRGIPTPLALFSLALGTVFITAGCGMFQQGPVKVAAQPAPVAAM